MPLFKKKRKKGDEVPYTMGGFDAYGLEFLEEEDEKERERQRKRKKRLRDAVREAKEGY